MNDFICPKCGKPGFPSVYLPMCTACANTERRKSGEIKESVQRIGLLDRISKWFRSISNR